MVRLGVEAEGVEGEVSEVEVSEVEGVVLVYTKGERFEVASEPGVTADALNSPFAKSPLSPGRESLGKWSVAVDDG